MHYVKQNFEDGTVLTAHYAESLADMPAMSELAEML